MICDSRGRELAAGDLVFCRGSSANVLRLVEITDAVEIKFTQTGETLYVRSYEVTKIGESHVHQ